MWTASPASAVHASYRGMQKPTWSGIQALSRPRESNSCHRATRSSHGWVSPVIRPKVICGVSMSNLAVRGRRIAATACLPDGSVGASGQACGSDKSSLLTTAVIERRAPVAPGADRLQRRGGAEDVRLGQPGAYDLQADRQAGLRPPGGTETHGWPVRSTGS